MRGDVRAKRAVLAERSQVFNRTVGLKDPSENKQKRPGKSALESTKPTTKAAGASSSTTHERPGEKRKTTPGRSLSPKPLRTASECQPYPRPDSPSTKRRLPY